MVDSLGLRGHAGLSTGRRPHFRPDLHTGPRGDCIEQLEAFLEHYDAWLVPVTATRVFRHMEPSRHLAACRTEVWNFAAGLFFGCARSFFHLNGR